MAQEGMRVLAVARASIRADTLRPKTPREFDFEHLGLVGIAMGGRGTDVAREVASLILLDDDFTSIVAAIRLGRRIYDNLRKTMAYILAVHVPIAGPAVIPLLFGLPLVFWPLHIAFLDTMRWPPRDPAAPLLTPGVVAWALFQGALVLVFVITVFTVALSRELPEGEARALAFAVLVATNVGLVLVNRSTTTSVIDAFRRPKGALWWVLAITGSILAAIALITPARELFRFGLLHVP
jgi:Ca2+-transporting ATPase